MLKLNFTTFKILFWSIFLLLTGLCLQSLAEEVPNGAAKPVIVEAAPLDEYPKVTMTSQDTLMRSTPDTAALLKSIPGANCNVNGPCSGQVQYRGMFGPKMNVMIDGMSLIPACPNWMDPPLHSIPEGILETLEMKPGIASVTSGIETYGGTIAATSRQSQFTEGDEWEIHGNLDVGGATANTSYNTGGNVSLSNDQHRIDLLGSSSIGNDLEIPGGTLVQTRYQLHTYGGGYGLRLGDHEMSFRYRRVDSDEAGTPSLPMDSIYVETDFFEGEYKWTINDVILNSKLFFTNSDHEMDNFTMRQPNPLTSKYRVNTTMSDGFGYKVHLEKPISEGLLKLGVDGRVNENNAEITNPNNASFFVEAFHNAEKDQHSLFTEWNGRLFERLNLLAGIRYTFTRMNADNVVGPSAMAAQNLANAFNAADRYQTDHTIDWHLEIQHELTESFLWELGFARKTRTPSFLERYAWIPLEASSGLADRNIYVGDIGLKPEVSHLVELGATFENKRFHFSPRGFYRLMNNSIRGESSTNANVIMVATSNGDATPLQFSNVDAEMYGTDFAWGIRLSEQWFVDGILSYVRGRRRKVDEDLYRIAPLNGSVALNFHSEKWKVKLENVFAAAQTKVSSISNEPRTAGYSLVNFSTQFQFQEGWNLTLGVENMFDTFYRDHLSGLNRVSGSDTDIGLKLPGSGRNFFLNLSYKW